MIASQFQLFDLLPKDEFSALKADIAKRGVLVPVEYDQDGNVLDGHHRLQACQELGIKDFPTVVRRFATDDEKEEHVVTLNVRRRHLNGEQKRRWAEWFLRRHPDRSDRQIGRDVGLDNKTVASVRDELEAREEIPHVSTRADSLGRQQPAEKSKPAPAPTIFGSAQQTERAQSALLTLGDAAPAGQMELKEAVKLAARQREPEPVPTPVPPPAGKYHCIVIDPPWPMQKIERDERPNQGVTLDYPVMSLEDIADEAHVPVRTLADDDCHIYLWVTHKFLPAGLDLLKAWGFNYQCVMTWRKNVGITPFSWMYDTEHVLFGRRGDLKLTRLGMRLSFEAPVAGHSRKPDVFYERVTEASPGPRVEMFSRVYREGFTPWGNEVIDDAAKV